MLIFPHRKYNKNTWKYLYRRFRIVIRETRKVQTDLILFGTAFSETDDEGLVRHIPADKAIISTDGKEITIKTKVS